LPDREGRHRVELRADRECPVAVVSAQPPRRQQRCPEPDPNSHRHRRHPKDKRDLGLHSARLALPGEQGNDLLDLPDMIADTGSHRGGAWVGGARLMCGLATLQYIQRGDTAAARSSTLRLNALVSRK
jgi:hypothetical protein